MPPTVSSVYVRAIKPQGRCGPKIRRGGREDLKRGTAMAADADELAQVIDGLVFRPGGLTRIVVIFYYQLGGRGSPNVSV